MTAINWKRVILGGLLAGLIINVSEYILNAVILADRWAANMRSLNRPEVFDPMAIVSFNIWGFLAGIFTVWLYAAMRPRYGAGPKTAILAAAAVWLLGYFMANVPLAMMHILPKRLVAAAVIGGAIEIVIAALVGAWIYREEPARMAAAT